MVLVPSCAKTPRAVMSAFVPRDSALWDHSMGLNVLRKVSNGTICLVNFTHHCFSLHILYVHILNILHLVSLFIYFMFLKYGKKSCISSSLTGIDVNWLHRRILT